MNFLSTFLGGTTSTNKMAITLEAYVNTVIELSDEGETLTFLKSILLFLVFYTLQKSQLLITIIQYITCQKSFTFKINY